MQSWRPEGSNLRRRNCAGGSVWGQSAPSDGYPSKRFSLSGKVGLCVSLGKTFRVFERELLEGASWKSGCFAQDSVGDWWLCLPVAQPVAQSAAPQAAVKLDLGLKDTVATSDGDKLEAGHFYRSLEQRIANARRRGHKRQAKRLHR